MSRGRVVETGPTRDVLRDPADGYTRQLLRSAPGLAAARGAAPVGVRPPATPTRPPLVTVEGLVKDFPLPGTVVGRRSVRAVDGVSFTINRS